MYPQSEFRGTWRQIGEQHGEAYRELVREQAAMSLGRGDEEARQRALVWTIERYSDLEALGPHWMDELNGLATGAGISLAEAVAIQLRPGSGALAAPEACTSFGAAADATADGGPLGGQTRDIDAAYQKRMFVGVLRPIDGPAIVAHSVPGELGGIGLNEHGVCVFGNTLHARSPRSSWLAPPILRRLMLEAPSAAAAITLLRDFETLPAGNLLMVDRHSGIHNAEIMPDALAVTHTPAGAYAHANNCTARETRMVEEPGRERIAASEARRLQLQERLDAAHGRVTVEMCKEFLADETGTPEPICRRATHPTGLATVAALIAEPMTGTLHISYGPPSIGPFRAYSL